MRWESVGEWLCGVAGYQQDFIKLKRHIDYEDQILLSCDSSTNKHVEGNNRPQDETIYTIMTWLETAA